MNHPTVYAIASDHGFVYQDQGSVRFDTKLPRRSGGTFESREKAVATRDKIRKKFSEDLHKSIEYTIS